MTPQQADAFLGAAARWLHQPDAPVQVGAIKAVAALADEVGDDVLRPHLARLYEGESPGPNCSGFAPVRLSVQPAVSKHEQQEHAAVQLSSRGSI
jgi:hypothetical protein